MSISVILVTYNRARLLPATIESILDQSVCDRPHRQLRVAILRPAEVRDQHEPAATPPKLLERRQRGADTCVIGDRAGGGRQRNVEVDPDEHALAVDVTKVP